MAKSASAKTLRTLGLSRKHAKTLARHYNTTGSKKIAAARAAAEIQAKRLLKTQGDRPASPSHVPGNPTSSRPTKSGRTAGNPPATKLAAEALAAGADPGEVKIMCAGDVDPDLQALWLASLTPHDDVRTLAADDLNERARIMAQDDTDPELRRMWLAQLAGRDEPAVMSSAPLGMDADRLELHQEAKTLADARCAANPRLDPAETYALAAAEIEDRRHGVMFR